MLVAGGVQVGWVLEPLRFGLAGVVGISCATRQCACLLTTRMGNGSRGGILMFSVDFRRLYCAL